MTDKKSPLRKALAEIFPSQLSWEKSPDTWASAAQIESGLRTYEERFNYFRALADNEDASPDVRLAARSLVVEQSSISDLVGDLGLSGEEAKKLSRFLLALAGWQLGPRHLDHFREDFASTISRLERIRLAAEKASDELGALPRDVLNAINELLPGGETVNVVGDLERQLHNLSLALENVGQLSTRARPGRPIDDALLVSFNHMMDALEAATGKKLQLHRPDIGKDRRVLKGALVKLTLGYFGLVDSEIVEASLVRLVRERRRRQRGA